MTAFRLLAATALLALGASAASAGTLPFKDWTLQRFSLFSKVEFSQKGAVLEVIADDAASLLWTRVPVEDWTARRAAWDWSVSQSVPATDLTVKGRDDRNLAIYFVFLPRAEAEAVSPETRITGLLDAPNARILVYVWGGNVAPGTVQQSPYLGPRGRTVVLRGAGTGTASERVDLAADYARAFGGAPDALVGLAVSADSDDTMTKAVAQVGALALN